MFETTFISPKTNNKFLVTIDEEGEVITAFLNGQKVGSIELRYEDEFDIYHIIHLAYDELRQQGVGKKSLEFHKECFNHKIFAGGESHSSRRLVNDGPGFIQRMRELGVVEKDYSEWNDAFYDGN